MSNFRTCFLIFLTGCSSPTLSPTDAARSTDDATATVDALTRDAAPVDAPTAVTPLCPTAPRDPVAYGRCALSLALDGGDPGVSLHVRVADDADTDRIARASLTLDGAEGASVTLRDDDGVWVLGRDPVGAMYGAMDLADQVRRDGPATLRAIAPRRVKPAVAFRAANLFLVLPVQGEGPWWFLDRGFWTQYLDLLAASRMNVLDLHGMYDSRSTLFPNALLYFATSASLPQAGIERADRERNLQMLREVVDMAAARGIRVGLMSYRAYVGTDDARTMPLTRDGDVTRYTREAAEDLARRVPNLWRFGFRIGESGRDARWYADTIVAGLRAAGTGVGAYTRTWGTDPQGVATISRATGGDLVLEAKFNGEQLGPPYPAAGASMAGDWRAYSYEGYLDAPEGYRFVYQVRAGGTHRIFREANLAYMRRLMPTTTHAGAEGFSFEFAHAFFAQRDYYHRDADRFSPWTFTRDAMSYLMAGRLAYDPTTSEQVFRDALRARAGTDALWAPMQSAGEVVPWVVSSLVCGPDHREDSPELEWHGDVAYWAQAPARQVQVAQHACAGRQGPFDAFAVAGPYETAQAILGAAVEPRVTTREVAEIVLRASQGAGLAADAQVDGAEARDVARECVALGDLGAYHGHKLRAATALAVYQGSGDAAWLAFARDESRAAVDAWRRLAVHTDHIAPFEDNLRTTPVLFGRRTIHWRDQLDLVATDAAAIDRVEAEVRARPPAGRARMSPAAWLATSRPLASHAPSSWRVEPAAGGGWSAALAFDKDPGDDVEVVALYKPVSALVDWRRAPMRREGGRFVAALPDTGRGVMTAVEVTWRAEGVAARWPDATRETPWRLTLR